MTSQPVSPSATPTEYAAWQRAMLGRAWIAATLLTGELGLTLVAAVAWRAQVEGLVPGEDVASISLLGGCAVAGLPVAAIIVIANLRARRVRRAGHTLAPARRLATTGQWLAAIRLLGFLTAAVLLASATSLAIDLADAFIQAVALFDTMLAVLVAIRTRSAITQSPP